MSENKNEAVEKEEQYSLNDDRRVKVLSPGALVAKRFFRNKTAVVGLTIIVCMFIFSFIGGLMSPYKEDQLFYRTDEMYKDLAGAKENTEYRYLVNDSDNFSAIVQANTILAIGKNAESFDANGKTYELVAEGNGFYGVMLDGKTVGAASKELIYLDEANNDFDFNYNLLKAYSDEETESFEYNGKTYSVSDIGGIYENGTEIGYISNYVVNPITGENFSRAFKEELQVFLQEGDAAGKFKRDGENEAELFEFEGQTYAVAYSAANASWTVKAATITRVYDTYSAPSSTHWLGTDKNGMDMLTRLMYGGRISLVIGFIVVVIEDLLGMLLGGLSGYFGKWVDMLIMRIVDILYCIPSTPILIIIGAAMDALGVDPMIRMFYLTLILGFLGWPGVARIVRGQILSLREQEFMTATEATGISVYRRIVKHLLPNVMPQLIVISTMGLGSTILTEATLSFLGLGVRFPFASWGNIINDVNNTFVLTNYWFIWIPAGVCILLTVLAFNLLGDGLRDAFDPKMKR